MDFLIQGVVLVELKATRLIEPPHVAQLLNYLRCTDIEVGLVLNFGPTPRSVGSCSPTTVNTHGSTRPVN